MSVRSGERGSVALPTLVVVASVLLSGPGAAQEDGDRWWAADKALHFSVSAVAAGGIYAISVAAELDRGEALLVSGAASFAAGVGKELFDLTVRGNRFSGKDLVWDGIGVAVGLLLAWGIDLAVRGVAPEGPELFRF